MLLIGLKWQRGLHRCNERHECKDTPSYRERELLNAHSVTEPCESGVQEVYESDEGDQIGCYVSHQRDGGRGPCRRRVNHVPFSAVENTPG